MDRKTNKKIKIFLGKCLLVFICFFLFLTLQKEDGEENEPIPAYASEQSTSGEAQLPVVEELDSFNKARFWFFLIFCIAFGVFLCIAIALWGSPQVSLRERYKAVRKKQKKERKLQEKLEREQKKKQENEQQNQ